MSARRTSQLTRDRMNSRPFLRTGVSTSWRGSARAPEYEPAHPWDEEQRPWTDEDEAALEEYEDRKRRRLAEAAEY